MADKDHIAKFQVTYHINNNSNKFNVSVSVVTQLIFFAKLSFSPPEKKVEDHVV